MVHDVLTLNQQIRVHDVLSFFGARCIDPFQIGIIKHPVWRTNWLILGKIHKDSEAPTNWPLLARLEREIMKLTGASKSSAVDETISPKKSNQFQ